MKYIFRKLIQENALIIADEWKYQNEYSFYDMLEDQEDYDEFVNEDLRNKNDHYEVIMNNELIGFFCISDGEIGLGLKPSYTGKGYGKQFVLDILDFLKSKYKYKTYYINVATFNKRAIKVYSDCGFIKTKTKMQETNNSVYEFLEMKYEVK